MKLHTLLLLTFAAACGDNPAVQPDASGVTPDASAQVDAPPATPDAPATPVIAPFAVPLSAAGIDQLQAVIADGPGHWLAAGYRADAIGGTPAVVVVRLTNTGIDTTFGTSGVVVTPLVFRGGAGEIAVAKQSTGHVVVSATIADATNAADRDVGVVRLTPAGQVDTSFGTAGLARVNPGTFTVAANTDAARGFVVDASDNIYVYGLTKGDAARIDRDMFLVKLSATGLADTAFAGNTGLFRFNIQDVSETARGILLDPAGRIYLSGYANTPGLGTVQPLVVAVKLDGTRDTTFGNQGVFHDTVLALQTEIYQMAHHGRYLVTGGYGRNTGTTNDWVSLRFDTMTNQRDTTWGGAVNGAVVFDVADMMAADNCRGAIAAGNNTVLFGSTGPANMPAQDAAVAVLDGNGMLRTDIGKLVLPLGANGNDQFWAAAANGNQVMLVGYQGGGEAAAQTATVNDDSFAALLTLPTLP